MACLLGRGWWLFGGSGGFGGRLLQTMVLGGGACSTRTVAYDGISQRRFCFGLWFWAVLFLFFSVHSLPL
jgi:hypothetical protein